jgi:opacity protein-like surface antigen
MTIRHFCIAATSAALLTSSATAADWPDWRGPMQDRHYDGPPLVTSFDPEAGTNVLWKSDEAGGISTPVIIGGVALLALGAFVVLRMTRKPKTAPRDNPGKKRRRRALARR